MTENPGFDDSIAAQQAAVADATGAPDQTQVAEDPTGEAAAYGGIAGDDVSAATGDADEVH